MVGYQKKKKRVGDGNNRYFHQVAKTREVRNSIREIQRGAGTVANTQEKIKVEAKFFFNNFLSHTMTDYNEISEEQLHDLLGFYCATEDGDMLTRLV